MQQPYASRINLILVKTARVLPNFDRYSVKVDMLDIGNPFTFSLWHSKNTDSAWAMIVQEVKLGGMILFTIDDAPQFSGRIETLSVKVIREQGAILVISGRDLAGTAISWDADPKLKIANKQLSDVVEELFAPLGVQVIIGDGADAEREVRSAGVSGARGSTGRRHTRIRKRKHTIARAKPKPGEKVMEFLQAIIKKLGYMAWVAPTADGSLAIIIDTPRYEQEPLFQFSRTIDNGVVTQDSDIIESDYHAQIRTIPTIVTAYGRSERGNHLPTRHATYTRPPQLRDEEFPDFLLFDSSGVQRHFELDPANPTSGYVEFAPNANEGGAEQVQVAAVRMPFTNDELLRFPFVEQPLPPQPLHLHTDRARDPNKGEQEARRAIANAMKDFRACDITVKGHTQLVNGERRTFSINTMCHVKDDLLDMSEDMLITSVEFNGSRKAGQTSTLTLGTKNAIHLTPDAEE
jgi:hypothetical protein